MSRLPAWRVDPAWPAVPPSDEDDEPWPADPEPQQLDLAEQERRALVERVATLHVEQTRLHLRLHHAERALRASLPAAAPRRRGRPDKHARNDRLLALYLTVPERHTKRTRCTIAAQQMHAETAEPLMPWTTVRDAIGEALHRRDAKKK
jgi:hypothetical protein